MSDGAPYISRSGDAFAYNRRGEVASATIADNATAYAYDHLSRRVRKTARDGVHTYFYDGWKLVLELIEHDGVTDRVEYVWGKDISGTLQGAGGIGGLLYLKRNGIIYIPHYDAYGNILGYYDAAGNIVASYTYDAFGKTIVSSGALADVFAFRFSTKYFDSESGHYYYGYRYYSPALRRWLTRDPIEEEGGMNLYGFCENDAVSSYDLCGNISVHFVSMRRAKQGEKSSKNAPGFVTTYVKTARDIVIVQKDRIGLGTEHGRFNPVLNVTACRVWVYLQIFISSSLDKSSQTSGRKFIIKPHVINGKASNASSQTSDKDATYRVLWDPILAHERGHASAYLAKFKSKFEDAARRFPNKLSPSQQEGVKTEYHRIYKEVEFEILKGADDPERTWYEQHGFSIRDLEGGEYEASN